MRAKRYSYRERDRSDEYRPPPRGHRGEYRGAGRGRNGPLIDMLRHGRQKPCPYGQYQGRGVHGQVARLTCRHEDQQQYY